MHAATSMAAPPRVLVADDDPGLLEAIVDYFDELGADVVRAENGAELLARLAEQEPIDLIVTDISMPWMNGLHVVAAARHAGVGAPVIVMTALDDARLDEKIEELGQRVVLLRKPFDLDELEATAVELLSSSRLT